MNIYKTDKYYWQWLTNTDYNRSPGWVRWPQQIILWYIIVYCSSFNPFCRELILNWIMIVRVKVIIKTLIHKQSMEGFQISKNLNHPDRLSFHEKECIIFHVLCKCFGLFIILKYQTFKNYVQRKSFVWIVCKISLCLTYHVYL